MSEDLKLEYTLKELVDVITIPTKVMRYALKQIYGLPDLAEDVKYVFRNGQRKLVNGVDQIIITSPYGFALTNSNFETYLLKAIRSVMIVNTWLPNDWVLPVKPVEPEEPVDPIEPEPETPDPIDPPVDPIEPEPETPDPIDPPVDPIEPETPPEDGFLGEQSVTGFIDGLELATQIGLTAGTAQHTDSPWLHFRLDGVELYIAKKPYRHTVSWDHINTAGAVFGDKTVEINGKTYKVRLLKTVASGNTYTGSYGYDPVAAYGSEWNRLMYSVHSTVHTDSRNPTPITGEGLHFGSLAQYTDTDLVTDYRVGSGSASWCQETPSTSPTARVQRGSSGVSSLYWTTASNASSSNGWRPVLELVD